MRKTKTNKNPADKLANRLAKQPFAVAMRAFRRSHRQPRPAIALAD